MKKIIFALPVFVAAFGLGYIFSERPVAQATDYSCYLNKVHLQTSRAELNSKIDFWRTKLRAEPGNYIYQKKLAGLYASDFKKTGNIHQLQQSDSLLQLVDNHIPGQIDVLFSLAANAITRHAFREAETYTKRAFATGEKRFISSLLLTDVYLERGDFFAANHLLQGLTPTEHFDYLIRKVKLQDQQGDLTGAIATQEKALPLAEATQSKSLINWTLSNLADMYGHDGKVEKSYQTFLRALEFDPSDFHALKGIAWIAFSHDKNTVEAKRILHFLQSVHPIPDYKLLLAEIAQYEGDFAVAATYRQSFLTEVRNPVYGNMYKSYCCKLECVLPNERQDALELAQQEILERPHPMSYALFAWSLFQNGDAPAALEILHNHVMGQTEEPVALYYAGVILKETGQNQEAKKYLYEAHEAGFELGPVVKSKIEAQLAQL